MQVEVTPDRNRKVLPSRFCWGTTARSLRGPPGRQHSPALLVPAWKPTCSLEAHGCCCCCCGSWPLCLGPRAGPAAAGGLRRVWTGPALKARGGKRPRPPVSQAAEHSFSWAAVQPDVKPFYFGRPCERRRRWLEEGRESVVNPVIVEGAVLGRCNNRAHGMERNCQQEKVSEF